MKLRHLTGLIIVSLFLLFIPGDHTYVKLFSLKKDIFAKEETRISYALHPFPYIDIDTPEASVSAQGVYVVDLPSFSPIFERNARERFLPASTTKIITALVAYDSYAFDEVLEVKRVVDEGQSMELVAGEKITFENLLYGILVHSANDGAYVLADNFRKGGYEGFVQAMNAKAQMLHMNSSSFKNPAGLDETGQYTSPFDLSLAARALLLRQELSKIVAIKAITVSDVDFIHFHRLANVNRLLGEIPGIGGLKTGFTEEAGEHLISLYKKNGHEYLIVLLKSEDRFADTIQMVNWIDQYVFYIDIPKPNYRSDSAATSFPPVLETARCRDTLPSRHLS